MENKEKKSNEKYNKTTTLSKSKKILVIILALIIVVAGYFVFKSIKKSTAPVQSQSEIDENSYNSSKIMRRDLTDINSINIDLESCDIRIQKSSTNPYLEYTNLYKNDGDNAYEIESEIEDGNLNIKSHVKGEVLNMKNKIQVLKIYLPQEGSLQEIKAKVESGDIKVNDLDVSNIDLNVKNGDLSFKDSNMQGNIKTQRGNIKLKDSSFTNGIIENEVGNIKLTNVDLDNDVSITSKTGSIDVKAKDPINAFNFEARLGVGNFTFGNISYRNIVSGYSSKNNNAKKFLTIKTEVGDISFNKGEQIEKKEKKDVEEDIKSVKEKLGDPLEGKQTDTEENKEANDQQDQDQQEDNTDQTDQTDQIDDQQDQTDDQENNY
ncbi:MAG: DUF4097 family beta strand repeat-containing protein [Tissierellia bacterium]|nr:DUF4097 family beta strand repeat-containing protein [Tissierellia bacterium]